MKVAIIGRGFGSYAMAPAYRELGWEVEIVPSRDEAAVARACAGPFDLISIHSPPFQHREQVLAAIAAGHDVLCDKPFGRNAAEAREMRDAAHAAGVLHFVNFEFRSGAARLKVQELLQSGTIGTLRHVGYSGFANFMRGREHGWLNDASLGGGWLGALGSHIIDALRWHGGGEVVDCGGMSRIEEPLRADGEGGQIASTAEDAFSVWLRLGNGCTGTIDSAAATGAVLPQRVQFLGSEGAVELVDENVVTLIQGDGQRQVFDLTPPPGGAWPAVVAWLRQVEDALRTRRQIAPSFDDGVATAVVLDALKAGMVRLG